MKEKIVVQKALNNNVIIAEHPIHKEIILIGKGIGFNKSKGDLVPEEHAEKTFLLRNQQDQEQYKHLLNHIDHNLMEILNDVMVLIESRMGQSLHEHIHVALTDHLSFAINRVAKDVQFSNPFLFEIESLYPKEYQVAQEVVNILANKAGVHFPEGEIGFIALHIHSAVTDKSLHDINRHHRLISKLVKIIEENLEMKLEKNDVNYNRLIQHLHRAIERVYQHEQLNEQSNLANVLKTMYPLCYNLAWKLIKVMQQQLHTRVDDSEALYLTIHLQRLTNQS
ncbi:glucose PTS transporter transcription antiterminator GlcT [Saliterribacillus persicus]|uniref:BglG family transcriptional antiterminator n=1 Tax=Saliterribacillus persicus TaxID=930114 RepID=A0A368XAJ0_9BACI|nr:PRD domain-containing protein [Saliterribacillus persicus]RCW63044.1 BglG family transcriptional antiterminator [Saliterribacillus persicus]